MTSSPDPAAAGEPSDRPAGHERRRVPAPLAVAVGLVGLESAVLVAYGVSLLPSLDSGRLAMGITSVAFFVLYGGLLGVCAWQLSRLRSWARAPVVLAQLIQILVGTGFWGGGTTAISVVLVALGVVALGAVFHPASLAALDAGTTPPQ